MNMLARWLGSGRKPVVKEHEERQQRRMREASQKLQLARTEIDVAVKQQAECTQCAIARVSDRPPSE